MADALIPFSPLSEFLQSIEAQGEWHKFLETFEGRLLIAAAREIALRYDGNTAGSKQDGAKCLLEDLLNLSLERRKLIEKAKLHTPLPTTKHLEKRTPPGPSLRGDPQFAVPPGTRKR